MMTTFTIVDDDIFQSKADMIVVPVSADGTLASGFGRQLRMAFPGLQGHLKERILRQGARAGEVVVYHHPSLEGVKERPHALALGYPFRVKGPRFVVCVITREHWKGRSQPKWVIAGLNSLTDALRDMEGVQDVAVTSLGLPHAVGKLPGWGVILAWAEAQLETGPSDHEPIHWQLYKPRKSAPAASTKRRG